MRSSAASTFFTTRPRATGDFSHGRRGRGVRYSRTIVNAYHVSLSCMQSPCAHHAPRWRRRVVSFYWCSFAAPAEAPATSPWRGRRGGPVPPRRPLIQYPLCGTCKCCLWVLPLPLLPLPPVRPLVGSACARRASRNYFKQRHRDALQKCSCGPY